jgi:hypothetical protein
VAALAQGAAGGGGPGGFIVFAQLLRYLDKIGASTFDI